MKPEIKDSLLPEGGKLYREEINPTYIFLKGVLFCGLIFGASFAFYRYGIKLQEIDSRVSELNSKVMELEREHNYDQSLPATDEVGHRSKRGAPVPEYPWVVRSADGAPILNPRRGEDSTEEYLVSNPRRRKVGRRPNNRRRVATEESIVGTRALPLPRKLGRGQDQVSARVVTFDESGTPKSESVVAHFVADVSNFTRADNPRLRNTDGVFQIWKPQDWNTEDALTYDKDAGSLTVHKAGVYYLYAQIHYHDENVEGFTLEVNDKPVLQCTSKSEINSCFTAGLTKVNENDRIVVKNIGQNIFSIFKPEKSFFGLMRVSD